MSFPHAHHRLAITVLIMVLVCVVGLHSLTAEASPNEQINYQGKLTDTTGAAVADGKYNMRFYLYDTEGAATTSAIWTETLTGIDRVQVTDGLFSVMLGSTTALTSINFNQTLYLGVEIGDSSASPSWDGEMSPRKVLGTVPAAFEAIRFDGLATSSFLRSDQADTASGLLTFTGGLISSASSTLSLLTFGTATGTTLAPGGDTITDFTGTGLSVTSGVLNVGRLATSSLDIAGPYTDGHILQASTTAAGGYAWAAVSSLGFVDGIGGSNRVAFWSDSDTLTSDSGFTFSSSILTVPALTASNASATSTIAGGLDVASGGLVYDFSTGNVGIGTTSPGSLLSVGNTNGINFSTATSTFSSTGGIDIASGCFAINGTCIGGSSSLFTDDGDTTYLTSLTDSLSIGTTSAWGRLSVSSENNSMTWQQVGTSTTISGVSLNAALTALSPNRVAFIDRGNDDLRVYEFNGTMWNQMGSDLNISLAGDAALAALSPNRIAFIETWNDDLRVYEFNGSTWSQIGNDLNISGLAEPALAALSPNRVAFIDSGTGDTLQVYEFNGSTWSQVGGDFTISGLGGPALAALSPNRVAFIDRGTGDALQVYEFNGSTWRQIGSDLTISDPGKPALAALSPNRVAFIDDDNAELRTYQFSHPLIFAGNNEDFPYFTVSDAGHTQAESMFVRTGLTVGQSATSTTASSTQALVVQGTSNFLSNVAIGTGSSSPSGLLTVNGEIYLASTTPGITSNALYNQGGILFFNGSVVGGGGSSLFTDGGDTTYLTSLTDNLAVGTTTSLGLLTAATSSSNTALAISQYGTGDPLNVFDGASEVFTIVDGGNVGIGTTTPSAQLALSDLLYVGGTGTSTFEQNLEVQGNRLKLIGCDR